MPVSVAHKILSFAKAGLPVIIVGSLPNEVPGIDPAGDVQLASVEAELLAQPSVHVVASEAAVPAELNELGVEPSAQPAIPGPVLSVHRHTNNTDYYYLYNQGVVSAPGEPGNLFDPDTATPVDTTFTLQGHGRPYLLNTWSGRITPIADYTRSPDGVTIHVKLAGDDSEIVAITSNPWSFRDPGLAAWSAGGVHVVSTTADAAVIDRDGRVAIQASQPGTYTSQLSNGRTITTKVTTGSAPIDLTTHNWALTVEAWSPTNPYATLGDTAVQTTKTNVNVALTSLAPWPDIPGLTHASGIGTYTTTVRLPSKWRRGMGARLSLGAVTDSFTVAVNGSTVPWPDQLDATVDIGRFLHPGANTLTVRVATTLLNELRSLDPVFAARPAEANGLVGPVTLTPYTEVPLT